MRAAGEQRSIRDLGGENSSLEVPDSFGLCPRLPG